MKRSGRYISKTRGSEGTTSPPAMCPECETPLEEPVNVCPNCGHLVFGRTPWLMPLICFALCGGVLILFQWMEISRHYVIGFGISSIIMLAVSIRSARASYRLKGKYGRRADRNEDSTGEL